ncbi:MAG: HAD family hydrolase [Polyangiaceae bacterium]
MTLVLVFDMGGVLYDFQGDRLIAETSRRVRRWRSEEVQAVWVPLVRGFETGACTEADFAAAVVTAFDLTLEPAQFLEAFRTAAVGYYDGALDLLSDLAERHSLLSLSNTNAVQWPKVLEDLGARDPFHAHHPSHVSGFHKPDPRAYAAVRAQHDPTTEFCFFDDRAVNVAAARALGWDAHRATGVAPVRAICARLGLCER